MTRSRFAGLMFATVLLAARAPAQNAQIRILCANGIREVVEQLTPGAEKAIGRGLSIESSMSVVVRKQIEGGAAFDIAILTPGNIEELAKSGKVVAGSQTTLASSDLGVGIKAGSPQSAIGTPDAMRKRLLAARSLTWTDGGASARPRSRCSGHSASKTS